MFTIYLNDYRLGFCIAFCFLIIALTEAVKYFKKWKRADKTIQQLESHNSSLKAEINELYEKLNKLKR